MRKLDINSFELSVNSNGDLYANSDITINSGTFWLDDIGNLYFNDDLPWIDDYYVLQTDGYYRWYEEETNV